MRREHLTFLCLPPGFESLRDVFILRCAVAHTHPTFVTKSRQKSSLRDATLRVPCVPRPSRRKKNSGSSIPQTPFCFFRLCLRYSVAVQSQLVACSGSSPRDGVNVTPTPLRTELKTHQGFPSNAPSIAGDHGRSEKVFEERQRRVLFAL